MTFQGRKNKKKHSVVKWKIQSLGNSTFFRYLQQLHAVGCVARSYLVSTTQLMYITGRSPVELQVEVEQQPCPKTFR